MVRRNPTSLMFRNATMPSMEPANSVGRLFRPLASRLVKRQCRHRRLCIRRTLRFLVLRSNRRMCLRVTEHGAACNMEDQYEDSDDGERGDAERRYVTRIHFWGSGALGGWRRQACYFRGHFGCSFRFVGIPAHASRDGSEPARQSNDGNGAAPVSPRGAASGEALRACA
jgi:hypothetical protein